MPDIKNNFTIGRMNKDLDERLVRNGEYRDAMNIQVRTTTSDGDGEGNAGSVQNIEGNKLIGQSYSGDYNKSYCVGSVADEKSDKAYFFINTEETTTDLTEIIAEVVILDSIIEQNVNNNETLPVVVDRWKIIDTVSGIFGDSTEIIQDTVETPVLVDGEWESSTTTIDVPSPIEWGFFCENYSNFATGYAHVNSLTVLDGSKYRVGMTIHAYAGASSDLFLAEETDNSPKIKAIINNTLILYEPILNHQLTAAKDASHIIFKHPRMLNFEKNRTISSINIIDNLLFWTDNVTEPKKINIDACKSGTDSLYSHTKIHEMDENNNYVSVNENVSNINPHNSYLNVDNELALSNYLSNSSVTNQYKINDDLKEEDIVVIKEAPKKALTLHMKDTDREGLTSTIIDGWSFVAGMENQQSISSGEIIKVNPPVDNNNISSTRFRKDDILVFTQIAGLSEEGDGIAEQQGGVSIRVKFICYENDDVNSDSFGEEVFESTNTFRILVLSTEGISFVMDAWHVELEQKKPLFERKLVRFAYRYKYRDGEYSSFSPWSELAFLPGKFDYTSKTAYNLGMVNNLRELYLKDFIPYKKSLEIHSIDILYKSTDSSNVYIAATVNRNQKTPGSSEWELFTPDPGNINEIKTGQLKITSEMVHRVLPSSQMLRSWDNVPLTAGAQEIVGNRLLYGNYTQGYNPPSFDLTQMVISEPIIFTNPKKSLKSIRDYKVGVVFGDKYGRETPVIVPGYSIENIDGEGDALSGDISIEKILSSMSNKLEVAINLKETDNPFKDGGYLKYYIKETSNEYYNLVMDRWYEADSHDRHLWLSFHSADRNKVDEETYLLLKNKSDTHEPVESKARYKILAIENNAPDFIKTENLHIGAIRNFDEEDTVGNSVWPAGSTSLNSQPEGFWGDDKAIEITTSAWNASGVGNTNSAINVFGREIRGKLQMRVVGKHASNGLKYYSSWRKISNYQKTEDGVKLGWAKKFSSSNTSGADMFNKWLDLYGSPGDTEVTALIYELEFRESMMENKPEFDGKFFVKIERDEGTIENIILATGGTWRFNTNYTARIAYIDSQANNPATQSMQEGVLSQAVFDKYDDTEITVYRPQWSNSGNASTTMLARESWFFGAFEGCVNYDSNYSGDENSTDTAEDSTWFDNPTFNNSNTIQAYKSSNYVTPGTAYYTGSGTPVDTVFRQYFFPPFYYTPTTFDGEYSPVFAATNADVWDAQVWVGDEAPDILATYGYTFNVWLKQQGGIFGQTCGPLYVGDYFYEGDDDRTIETKTTGDDGTYASVGWGQYGVMTAAFWRTYRATTDAVFIDGAAARQYVSPNRDFTEDAQDGGIGLYGYTLHDNSAAFYKPTPFKRGTIGTPTVDTYGRMNIAMLDLHHIINYTGISEQNEGYYFHEGQKDRYEANTRFFNDMTSPGTYFQFENDTDCGGGPCIYTVTWAEDEIVPSNHYHFGRTRNYVSDYYIHMVEVGRWYSEYAWTNHNMTQSEVMTNPGMGGVSLLHPRVYGDDQFNQYLQPRENHEEGGMDNFFSHQYQSSCIPCNPSHDFKGDEFAPGTELAAACWDAQPYAIDSSFGGFAHAAHFESVACSRRNREIEFRRVDQVTGATTSIGLDLDNGFDPRTYLRHDGYTTINITILKREVDYTEDEENVHGELGACWETEPKEDIGLDLYHEASSAIPLVLDVKNSFDFAPVNSEITVTRETISGFEKVNTSSLKVGNWFFKNKSKAILQISTLFGAESTSWKLKNNDVLIGDVLTFNHDDGTKTSTKVTGYLDPKTFNYGNVLEVSPNDDEDYYGIKRHPFPFSEKSDIIEAEMHALDTSSTDILDWIFLVNPADHPWIQDVDTSNLVISSITGKTQFNLQAPNDGSSTWEEDNMMISAISLWDGSSVEDGGQGYGSCGENTDGSLITTCWRIKLTGVYDVFADQTPTMGNECLALESTLVYTNAKLTLDINSNSGYYEVDSEVWKYPVQLPFTNCFAFGNGVESDRVRDDFNAPQIDNGVKVSTTFSGYGKESKTSGLIYSGLYNSTSEVNDLNEFNMAEKITKDLNPSYGSIQALKTRDTDVVVFTEDKVLKVLANKDTLYNADGNTQLTASDRVLGTAIPFVGDYGISQNPESLAWDQYRLYFTDKQRGAVLRLSRDGLTPISNVGMKAWFRDSLLKDNPSKILGTFDTVSGEYNLTLSKFNSQIADTTVSFNEASKGWVSFKSFIPEQGLSISGKYITALNSKIWEHYTPSYTTSHMDSIMDLPPQCPEGECVERNRFYNQSLNSITNSSITVLFNDLPSTIKSFKTLEYEGSESKISDNPTDTSHIDATGSTIPITDNEYYNSISRNGWWVSEISTDQQDIYDTDNYGKNSSNVFEFIEREGKYFNKINGLHSTDSDGLDITTDQFHVQGIGTCTTVTGGVAGNDVEDAADNTRDVDEYEGPEVYGCMQLGASNYNPNATVDDGSCDWSNVGCMDEWAINYDSNADTPCQNCCEYEEEDDQDIPIDGIYGCTDICASNYNANATIDNNSCIPFVYGCMDETMFNYDSEATSSQTSCEDTTPSPCIPYIYGCTDSNADNYNENANVDDGSCVTTDPWEAGPAGTGTGGTAITTFTLTIQSSNAEVEIPDGTPIDSDIENLGQESQADYWNENSTEWWADDMDSQGGAPSGTDTNGMPNT